MQSYARVTSGGQSASGIHSRILHPMKASLNYPRMKVTAIRIFSSVCVIFGILSIVIQSIALTISKNLSYVNFLNDVSGCGIWAGVFYLTAGSLGIAATRKRTKSLLVGTIVMSAMAIAVALIASPLSVGIGFYHDCTSTSGILCDVWRNLEWTLFAFHLLALVSTITLTVLASMALCTCACCAEHDDICKNPQEAFIVGTNGRMAPIPHQQPEAFQVTYDGQYETLFHKSTV